MPPVLVVPRPMAVWLPNRYPTNSMVDMAPLLHHPAWIFELKMIPGYPHHCSFWIPPTSTIQRPIRTPQNGLHFASVFQSRQMSAPILNSSNFPFVVVTYRKPGNLMCDPIQPKHSPERIQSLEPTIGGTPRNGNIVCPFSSLYP